MAAARLLALADPWAGDDAWSVGCRAYSFSRHRLRRAAEAGRYPWLGVLDGTRHFVFLIEGVPVRFFHGDAEDPTKRTLRQQEAEAEQLALAFGREDGAERLMFRLAVVTDGRGAVSRVVFLALRGEEGALARRAAAGPALRRPHRRPRRDSRPPGPSRSSRAPGTCAPSRTAPPGRRSSTRPRGSSR